MTLTPASPATSLVGYDTATLAAIVRQADEQLTNPNPAWHVTRATLEDIRCAGAEILHHRESAGYQVKQHHNGVPGWSVLDPTGRAVEVGVSYEFACHVAARLRAQVDEVDEDQAEAVCEGHYDEDWVLTSANPGGPRFCDGSCQA